MAKSKPMKLSNTTVCFVRVPAKQHVRVEVLTSHFGEKGWTFYVPLSTVDRFGFVPADIVKARMLRDFNVELENYAARYSIEVDAERMIDFLNEAK